MTSISITKTDLRIDRFSVLKNCFYIKSDWFNTVYVSKPEISFKVDHSQLHFLSRHAKAATVHPAAAPGTFQPELWKYDVAEFFLAAPDRSEYLEFNLAPNGAWWSCFFSSPRIPSRTEPLSGVTTESDMNDDGWRVQASIPLTEIPWPLEKCFLNATLILDSPEQRFFTLADLGGGEPDFHRPQHFLPISLSS